MAMNETVYAVLYFLKDLVVDKVNMMGARDKLAGYETCETVTGSSVAVNKESADTIYAPNATLISVQNGLATECFVKLIHTTDTLMAITAPSEYEWSGGVLPNLGKGVLIVAWGGEQGMLNFVSNVTVKNYTIHFVDKDSPTTELATFSDISIISHEVEYTVSGPFVTDRGNFYPIFDDMTRQAGTYTVGMMGTMDTSFTVMCEKVE